MSEDWAAVAKAISERMTALGLTQRELAERAHVSLAIVREIQRNTVQRRRSARTLEALSTALGWHPGHVTAVARGHRPPEPSDPPNAQVGEGFSARLTSMDNRLSVIAERLAEMNANLAEMNASIATVVRQVHADR